MARVKGADFESAAVISYCGAYRYRLDRRWEYGPTATFVMLNPSTADANADDPTIRRCVGFAKAWGCGALTVVNLYALRSTDPKGLWRVTDPVGPDNDEHLTIAAQASSGPLVAAWGANAELGRVLKVRRLPGMTKLRALGVTKIGQPRHPLYMRAAAQLTPWPEAAA